MKANPSNTRFSLFDELDRGLNHLVNEVLQHDTSKNNAPPLSVYERENDYLVECDIPGVAQEDVAIQINDGVLEISGERRNPVGDDAKVTVNERTFSEFRRTLQLSKDVNAEGVDAELGNGVLRVTIPKADSVLPRKVTIRRADLDPSST